MLNEAEIICFAATKNVEAAKRFYEESLGLTLSEDSPLNDGVRSHTSARYATMRSDVHCDRGLRTRPARGGRGRNYD